VSLEKVVINEIYIGDSIGSHQWVELYNNSEKEIDLGGWIIDDSGGSTYYQIDQGTKIGSGEYKTFQSGKFYFNPTTPDSVILKDITGKVDRYDYSASVGNLATFCRYPDGSSNWTVCQPTKDSNNILASTTPTPTSTLTSIPTLTPTPTPTPLSTSTPAQGSSLTITATFPSSVKIGESFNVDVQLSNADSNSDYYLKVRLGTDESHLTKGETENNGKWFSDTEGWSNFPRITTDGAGNWTGQLKARIKQGESGGEYKLRVRAHSVEEDKNYDSSVYGLSAEVETPTPTSLLSLTPTVTATPTLTSILSLTFSPSGEILGATEAGEATFSLHLLENEKPEEGTEEEKKTSNSNSSYLWPKVLISLGSALIIGASYPLWLPKLKNIV